jgi:small subunit ribosomal protein S16
MVRIRLRRQGAKKQPTYRVVVADSRSPRDGRFIENIGFYDPRTDPPTIDLQADRALYWLGVGAQPSDAVLRMLKKQGVWQEFTGVEESTEDFDTPELEESAAEETADPEGTDEPAEGGADEVATPEAED